MPTETTPAGAMPAVEGATPSQTTPVSPATGTPADDTPATGDAEAMRTDAGKQALEQERTARRDAEKRARDFEKELTDLRKAGLSEQERAVAEARDAGRNEVLSKAQEITRRAEVRRALTVAGCSDPELARLAPDFTELAVTDEGDVPELDKAISTFKAAHPSLFVAKAPGSFDTGTAGGRPAAGRIYSLADLRDPAFYQANEKDILAARAEGRITG
jgi:hypothetical protein